MTALLTCESLDAGYPALTVLRDFDFSVHEGEIITILGPNGAGKTTLLHTMAGLLPHVAGTLTVRGIPVTRRHGPERFAREGVVFVPDDRCLFPSLTVREHLYLAARRGGLEQNDVVAYFPGLEPRLDTAAGSLSGGEQQMLAMGRALAQRPSVLLIDELSMGLAPIIVEDLLAAIRQVARAGMAVVFVEQHVDLALTTADQAIVLVHGEIALQGSAQDLLDDRQELELAYLGSLNEPSI